MGIWLKSQDGTILVNANEIYVLKESDGYNIKATHTSGNVRNMGGYAEVNEYKEVMRLITMFLETVPPMPDVFQIPQEGFTKKKATAKASD